MSQSVCALVVAPAAMEEGGLGGAASQITRGLVAHGIGVEHVSLASAPVGLRLANRRPLRRLPAVGRASLRRAVAQAIPDGPFDLSWAVPGYLPPRGRRVLHCATYHPDTVRDQLAHARRRMGGGRGFITSFEARLLRAELEAAEVIRTESRRVALDLQDRGVDPSKIVDVRPGIDLQRFRPSERDDRTTVAFVGTFSLWKGADVLLQTAANLAGRATVRTIGGPVDPFTRRLMERAPIEPFVGSPESLLSSSHALLLPSASDGFGYVVLEAMACGAVPFVTPVVGAADVVEEVSSDLVIAEDEFAEAVPELLHSLPLEDLGRRAREIAEGYERDEQGRAAAGAILAKLNIP